MLNVQMGTNPGIFFACLKATSFYTYGELTQFVSLELLPFKPAQHGSWGKQKILGETQKKEQTVQGEVVNPENSKNKKGEGAVR